MPYCTVSKTRTPFFLVPNQKLCWSAEYGAQGAVQPSKTARLVSSFQPVPPLNCTVGIGNQSTQHAWMICCQSSPLPEQLSTGTLSSKPNLVRRGLQNWFCGDKDDDNTALSVVTCCCHGASPQAPGSYPSASVYSERSWLLVFQHFSLVLTEHLQLRRLQWKVVSFAWAVWQQPNDRINTVLWIRVWNWSVGRGMLDV